MGFITRRHFLARFAPVAVLAAICSIPMHTTGQEQSRAAKNFAGTWHLLFQGKPFATLVIQSRGGEITGSMTNGNIHTDRDGHITDAGPAEGSSPIIRAALQGGVLRIVEKDGDEEIEWAMTLISATSGELRIAGADAPQNVEAISLERAQ